MSSGMIPVSWLMSLIERFPLCIARNYFSSVSRHKFALPVILENLQNDICPISAKADLAKVRKWLLRGTELILSFGDMIA